MSLPKSKKKSINEWYHKKKRTLLQKEKQSRSSRLGFWVKEEEVYITLLPFINESDKNKQNLQTWASNSGYLNIKGPLNHWITSSYLLTYRKILYILTHLIIALKNPRLLPDLFLIFW